MVDTIPKRLMNVIADTEGNFFDSCYMDNGRVLTVYVDPITFDIMASMSIYNPVTNSWDDPVLTPPDPASDPPSFIRESGMSSRGNIKNNHGVGVIGRDLGRFHILDHDGNYVMITWSGQPVTSSTFSGWTIIEAEPNYDFSGYNVLWEQSSSSPAYSRWSVTNTGVGSSIGTPNYQDWTDDSGDVRKVYRARVPVTLYTRNSLPEIDSPRKIEIQKINSTEAFAIYSNNSGGTGNHVCGYQKIVVTGNHSITFGPLTLFPDIPSVTSDNQRIELRTERFHGKLRACYLNSSLNRVYISTLEPVGNTLIETPFEDFPFDGTSLNTFRCREIPGTANVYENYSIIKRIVDTTSDSTIVNLTSNEYNQRYIPLSDDKGFSIENITSDQMTFFYFDSYNSPNRFFVELDKPFEAMANNNFESILPIDDFHFMFAQGKNVTVIKRTERNVAFSSSRDSEIDLTKNSSGNFPINGKIILEKVDDDTILYHYFDTFYDGFSPCIKYFNKRNI